MGAKFTIPMDVLAGKMLTRAELVVRRTTFELFTAVKLRTPVDTGRLRANWNISAGSPDVTTTESVSEIRVNEQINKVLGPSIPFPGVTYMSNGLPYAYRIEYEGWSKRSPAGMVRVTALEFGDAVLRAAKSLP